ncbi:MAG: LysR family transcriptional regulator [Alphaproteobacteria bacterium]|nr:LysR family transcriptional regulator [Alphaproteobacteria bacterium]
MARGLPPLSWIRTFDAAARNGSFTAAAEALGVTQSAVSQQIRLLESWLGEPLFQRGARRLSLTPAGHALRPHVLSALDTLEAGTRALSGGAARSQRVSLRCAAAGAIYLLAPIFAAHAAETPAVTLKVSTAIWPDDTADPGAELEIRVGGDAWPGFDALRLTEETILPVAAPETAAAIGGDPDALAGAVLIDVVGYETGWETWFAAQERPAPDAARRLAFDNEALAMETARAGGVVTLGRGSLVAADLASGALAPAVDRPVAVSEGYVLLKPSGERLAPPAAALARRILAAFDRPEPPAGWV